MVHNWYPFPGRPLAPKLLADVLRIPVRSRRGKPRVSARGRLLLADLDAETWNRFPRAVCKELGRQVVFAVGRAARTSSVLASLQIPPLPHGLRLADLELETRTQNALVAAGFGQRPQDLGKLTADAVLRLRGFWAKSLVDLLTALEYATAHPETRAAASATGRHSPRRTGILRPGAQAEGPPTPPRLSRALVKEAAALGKIAKIRHIPFNDPRLGGLLRAMDTESDTVGEMVGRVRRRRLVPADPAGLPEQWQAFRQRMRSIQSLPLETELVEIFAAGFVGRDRQIVTRYFGWDGQGRHTLEALGQKYGVSRERIRQICSRAIKQHRNIAVFAPALDRAIAFLAARIPRSLAALQAEFDKAGISAGRLPIELVLEAAPLLGRQPPCVLVAVEEGHVAVAASQARLPAAIARAAKQVAANYGAATVSRALEELSARAHAEVPRKLVDETLQLIAGFRWLDARRQWFQRDGTHPSYGLPNMIGKILSVCPRITVSRMSAALARNRRSRRPLPPPRVLLEFCRAMPGVRVEGTTIVAAAPRSWHTALADAERVVARALKRHGPILERAPLEELCLRRSESFQLQRGLDVLAGDRAFRPGAVRPAGVGRKNAGTPTKCRCGGGLGCAARTFPAANVASPWRTKRTGLLVGAAVSAAPARAPVASPARGCVAYRAFFRF